MDVWRPDRPLQHLDVLFTDPLLMFPGCVLWIVVIMMPQPCFIFNSLTEGKEVFTHGVICFAIETDQSSCLCSRKASPEHDASTPLLHCRHSIMFLGWNTTFFSLQTQRVMFKPMRTWCVVLSSLWQWSQLLQCSFGLSPLEESPTLREIVSYVIHLPLLNYVSCCLTELCLSLMHF